MPFNEIFTVKLPGKFIQAFKPNKMSNFMHYILLSFFFILIITSIFKLSKFLEGENFAENFVMYVVLKNTNNMFIKIVYIQLNVHFLKVNLKINHEKKLKN